MNLLSNTPTVPDGTAFASFNFSRAQPLPANATDEQILAVFTPEEQETIRERMKVLGALAAFISQDFELPVTLNIPGEGWHFNYQAKVIRVDPIDLLERPIEYLRFVIGHEAAHRRISYLSEIPYSDLNRLGYLFLTNALEDARTNNFLAKGFLSFDAYLEQVYHAVEQLEARATERAMAELGHVPKFVLACFGYIREWLAEVSVDPPGPVDAPAAVHEVLAKTSESASLAWNSYPLVRELDESSTLAQAFAKQATQTIQDQIWPIYRALLDDDLNDQQLQQFLQRFQRQQNPQSFADEDYNYWREMSDPDLKRELSEEAQKELEQALKDGTLQPTTRGTGDRPFDLSKLSPEAREKLQQLLESLRPESQQKFEARGADKLREFERGLSQDLNAALAEVEGRSPSQEGQDGDRQAPPRSKSKSSGRHTPREADGPNTKDRIEPPVKPHPTERGDRRYHFTAKFMARQIRELEHKFRSIFREKRESAKHAQYKSGPTLHLRKRIGEIAKEVPAVKTRSWERTTALVERDYAITILVDLSGSMSQEKINETFKAVVAVIEPLIKLGIKVELYGYNSKLYRYKRFNERLDSKRKAAIGSMVEETGTANANYSDDGWAMAKASTSLKQTSAKKKFLIVLTDGLSNASPEHNSAKYRTRHVVEIIKRRTDQFLLGLGVGPGTDFVRNVYPNSIANVKAKDLPRELARLLEEIFRDDSKFKR